MAFEQPKKTGSSPELRREAAAKASAASTREAEQRERIKAELAGDEAVPDSHRDELKHLARAYMQTVGYHRPARGKQDSLLEQSFWAHFPVAGEALEAWDAALAEHEAAQASLAAWLREQHRLGYLLQRPLETGSGLSWTMNSGHLWLGGYAVAPLVDERNVDELKRPLEDLLALAKTTRRVGTVTASRSRLERAEDAVVEELRRISALHVIRGKCDLC